MRGSSIAVLYMLYQAGRKCKGCATAHEIESTSLAFSDFGYLPDNFNIAVEDDRKNSFGDD